MKKTYDCSLFIFRRDLRLEDNLGLLAALEQSTKVITCFIATPEQLEDKHNLYKADNCVQFMVESLEDLESQLKGAGANLNIIFQSPEKALASIYATHPFEAVFVNKDYTPYAIKRDDHLKTFCKKKDIDFLEYDDYTLQPVGSVLTKQKTPFKVFTSFYNAAKKNAVEKPTHNKHTNYVKSFSCKDSIHLKDLKKFFTPNPDLAVNGGRTEGLKHLKKLNNFESYAKERDLFTYQTTQLSAYNKFGCMSIREVYHAVAKQLGTHHPLIRQLYWRDFFYNISFSFPFVFGSTFQEKFRKLSWTHSKKIFESWTSGTTGFPIIDACIRQLNTTGLMHNRGRMLVASFLTKDLHINWQEGEHYFATKLVDYDPAQNNGNWQWAASTGVDASPYFRIFNPWTQSKEYDPEAAFIKRWIPELKHISAKHLHKWDKYHELYSVDYPRPIVDHAREAKQSLNLYKSR